MKLYKLLPLILIFVYTNAYGAYTGTLPKDIGTSTPLGSENPNVIDDVLRERGTIQYNLYKLKFVGTDTTLLTNDTWVVGSSSTAMLITMPAASSCANSSVTKPFVITNYSSGTITLNVSVDGVGSPTIKGSQTMSLFTDGTRWYEIRAGNAYDSDYLGGVIASGYARSGSNSDITEITGLTTYLAVGQGGSGTNTAAGAASAFGVGTEDSPTFTGVTATTGSTTTHTSTTLTATTGTITNLLSTAGTVTTLNSTTGNITNQVTTTGTITTLNSTTGNITNLVTTTGTVTTLNSTTGNITTGNVTNLSTTTGTVTTLNSTTGNITNLATTTGTVTTLNSTTGNITNQNTTTGTITTGNIANLLTTTGTITTLNNTNLSGGAGTFTGNVQMASATGFDYLKQWRVDSTIGTGSLNFAAGLGITFTPTYANGNGTITVTASGTSSAGGWTHTGTQTIGIAGSQVLPGGTLTINADYGMTGVLDEHIPNTITLDNVTQITARQLADMQGLLSVATQTGGVGFSSLLGVPTESGTFSVTGASGKIPVGSTTSRLDSSWMSLSPNFDQCSIGTTTQIGTGSINATGSITSRATVITDRIQDLSGSSTIQFSQVGSTTTNYRYYAFKFADNYAGSGDMGVRRIELQIGTGTSVYPPVQSNAYATATTSENTYPDYTAYRATDPTRPLTGTQVQNSWLSLSQPTNQRFHIDVGTSGATLTRIYYENFHNSGVSTTAGVKNFTLWGSNNASDFSNLAYASVGDWALLPTSQSTFDQHSAADAADPKYITVSLTPRTSVASYNGHLRVGTSTSDIGTTSVYPLYVDGNIWVNGVIVTTSDKEKKVEWALGTRSNFLDNFKNMKIGKWSWKLRDIHRLDAEAVAKKKYLVDGYKDWEQANIKLYSVSISGSTTIGYDKMRDDYEATRQVEWMSDLTQQSLIDEVENNLEADKDIYFYPFAGDPSTPDEIQTPDKNKIILQSLIGQMGITVQELIKRVEEQQVEIGKLKAIVNP